MTDNERMSTSNVALLRWLTVVVLAMGFALPALSEEIWPTRGFSDDEPPFLLHVHGCPPIGSLSVRIERERARTLLVLPPTFFQEMRGVIDGMISNERRSSDELKKAIAKAREFEDGGNMPAMQHWALKASDIDLQIRRSTNRAALPMFAKTFIANGPLPEFYGTSPDRPVKAKSLDELIAITEDRCVPRPGEK